MFTLIAFDFSLSQHAQPSTNRPAMNLLHNPHKTGLLKSLWHSLTVLESNVFHYPIVLPSHWLFCLS